MSQQKSDISTRIEDEERRTSWLDSIISTKEKDEFESDDDDSDENFDNIKDFDLEEAWLELVNLPDTCKVVLSEKIQKQIGLEVGVNVTEEFPWKMIKLKTVTDYLFDEVDNIDSLKKRAQSMKPDDIFLIGYCKILSDDIDTFIIFENNESAKVASEIIKDIETYERYILHRITVKRGRRSKSRGNEKFPDFCIPKRRTDLVDVEIQSVYPAKHSSLNFSHRYADDVRDGYVELLSGYKKFENIFRKTVDSKIQSGHGLVHIEQQTEPTFPTNSWSQYLYEINDEDEVLDVSDEETTGKIKKPSGRPTSPTAPPQPPKLSEHVWNLLETLEFNQVDMYKNDYPIIGTNLVPKHKIPFFEEILCFANISRSYNRYVCGVTWYPTISGLVVISYTFSTLCTKIKEDDKTDIVKRAVIENNPVLMWSFDDTLNYKFEFETAREITCLSFCPYDENVLIGGTINGQIMIWDLQNRISNPETEEILTPSQIRYRNIIRSFLSWSKQINQSLIIRPAAISALETSHSGPVTTIKWLSRSFYVTTTGQARKCPTQCRYFVTNSVDGSIAFWNLDSNADVKRKSKADDSDLKHNISVYKKLDRIFKPQYMIIHPHPLSAIECDTGIYEYITDNLSEQYRKMSMQLAIQVKEIPQEDFHQNMICGTMTGGLYKMGWEGFDFSQPVNVNKEIVQATGEFGNVHDGPIIGLERNPYYPQLFASIGRNVLALWKEDFQWTPILWRKRPDALSAAKWSYDRPSVLLVTRSDGAIEIWDFISRTDDAVLIDRGSVISTLSEHRPAFPNKLFGIGDYNSAFRMLLLPATFHNPIPNELNILKEFVAREEVRKTKLSTWEKDWCTENSDILEANRMALEDAQLELELLQKEAKEKAQLREKQEAAKKASQTEKKKDGFDLPEKLEKKWDDMNLRRLMMLLMARKRVNPIKLEKETVLEKDRLEYMKNKKLAIKKSFQKINEDIAEVRARLLPTEKDSLERIDMVYESANGIVQESETFETIETIYDDFILKHLQYGDLNYSEFLERGRQRRQIINKSLGGNTSRRHLYNNMKKTVVLSKFDFDY